MFSDIWHTQSMRRLWILLVAPILVAGCSLAHAVTGHSAPAHSAAWTKGYKFAQANTVNFGLTGWSAIHWCAQESTQSSNYFQAPQQNAWAEGCTSGLTAQ